MRHRTYFMLLLSLVAVLVGTFVAQRRESPRRSMAATAPVAAKPAAGSAVETRSEPPPARGLDRGRPLFTYEQPANAAALDAALPAPSQKINYVRIDPAMLAGKNSPFWQQPGEGRLTLPLPGGGALAVVIDSSEMLGASRFVSRGRVEGSPDSRVTFAANEGFLHASVEGAAAGSFALRAATAELAQFYQVDPALVLPCGGERRPVIDGTVMAALAERQRRARSGDDTGGAVTIGPGRAAAIENPQRAEVHVMMLYTPAVMSTMTGSARTAALQSAFDEAIERVNAAFAASLITARLKLVRVAETAYDEEASAPDKVQDDALTALYRPEDGRMDNIHALRDESGADIVCLALQKRDAVSSGLSFLLDQPGELANALFAFAVVQYGNVAGTHVVAHEIGHVCGCAHDRENATSGQGAYPFSYGYRFFGANGREYRDIMAYPPGQQLAYFSTPAVVLPAPISVAIGVAAGAPGEADTARTIEDNAHMVANYRLQTQAAAHVGALVNVATRAFVGTDDQVLIGGFVVAGVEPKRMLVRAAGPALRGFGVTDALGNPRLQLFRGATPVAENDDWSVQAQGSAADIAAAASRAGAFAFAAGSADAALLLSLAPGAYTAVVQGAGGSTGSGLVEAYQVDRAGTRIINLATRGYADNQGRELLGGFVVEAAAGATKRILIRALGPTLGRAPYNIAGALFDPYMELRGADGRVLIGNDDWSSGARVSGGARDDFQPTVRYYNEQQIAATGFAPANRREPCLLVDLPAGNYTVVVKPFELRDPDPEQDQPAQPGVGIVEVYEIER